MAFWEDRDCCWCCCCQWLRHFEMRLSRLRQNLRWLRRLPWPRQNLRWLRRRGLSKEDIEFLKRELRSIQAALCLVGAVPPEQLPQDLKFWADQSRKASYDIQDILDTFLVRVEEAHPDSSKGLIRKMARSFLLHSTCREIAEAIVDAKRLVDDIGQLRAWHADGFHGTDASRVQEITERRSRYRAYTIAATYNPGANSVDPRLGDLIKDETRLVGADRAMEDVIRRLMDTDDMSNRQLKTVCIVGLGGSGKTTLASAVYQKLQPLFDCSAFVSLSLDPNINKVLNSIIQQLDEGKHISEASGDEEQPVGQLRQLLQDKRYLIAVDDIWDGQSWEAIRGAMVDNNLGSRIITTTRMFDVAEKVGGAYKLEPLSIDDSKKLFYQNIFGNEGKYPENQWDGILDKILKKCSGSPLALLAISGILAHTPREEWYKVFNIIDSGPEGGSEVDTVREILLHSYYQLPSHLRPCFLYISMFPEGYEIRRDRLVWRWIAEGFIKGKQGRSLFQIGQKYFEELLNRSLILQVDKDDVSDGMTKYCLVHDMVLDLSCYLARDENFVTIMVDEKEPWIFLRDRVIRRLSLQNSQLGRRAHTLYLGRHVRSVAAFGTGINLMPPLSRFHILRVLDLEGCDLMGSYYNPEHLGKLLHLRYLGLRGTNVSQLPKDIGNLRFLQILDLKGTMIRKLPSTVALLRKLLCLYAEPETRIHKGMGNLTSLEELTKVSVSKSPSLVKELNSLVDLRVLDIVLQQEMRQSSQKDLVESLRNLDKLQTLRIFGNYSELDFMTELWLPPPSLRRFVTVNGWFSVLPTWISDADNLSELQIGVRKLWREGLRSLGRLWDLRFLCLAVERMDERLAVDADAFPNLTQLRLSAETCLVFRRGAMPKLAVLEFVLDVDKSNGDFDWGLINLFSLEKVTVNLRSANGASANEEAKAALNYAVTSHPNRPILKVTLVTSHQNEEHIESVDDDRAGNVASSSEIQEERSA